MASSADEMLLRLEQTAAVLRVIRWPERFQVQLEKRSEGQPLGLGFKKASPGEMVAELLLVSVQAGSALADRNAAEVAAGRWDRVVLPGMRISAVDGVEGDLRTMVEVLRSPGHTRILDLRRHQGHRGTSANVGGILEAALGGGDDREAEAQAQLVPDAFPFEKASAQDAPDVMFVESPNGQEACSGRYEIAQDMLVNGMPVWHKTGDNERWIFCAHNGLWFIADESVHAIGFRCARGYIHGPHAEDGLLPHNLIGHWERVDGQEWSADPGIVVSSNSADVLKGGENNLPRML